MENRGGSARSSTMIVCGGFIRAVTDGVGNGRFSQSADVTTTKPITPTTLPIGDSTIWQTLKEKYKENYKYI